jgi:hypothetical protein
MPLKSPDPIRRLPFRVPPAPAVMARRYVHDSRQRSRKGQSLGQCPTRIAFTDSTAGLNGVSQTSPNRARTMDLVAVPTQQIYGTLRVIVSLADSPDPVGARPPHSYEDMLFSSRMRQTGGGRANELGHHAIGCDDLYDPNAL